MVKWSLTLCCCLLQVDGTGNCLFSAIKKSLLVHTTTSLEATYFPNQYIRRMVVNYMVNHCQLIYKNKFLALMSLFSVEERADMDRGWNPLLSFKKYLRLLLRRDFWGNDMVLYAVSSMKITVLNMKILQDNFNIIFIVECMVLFLISVLVDEDLLKLVLECLALLV